MPTCPRCLDEYEPGVAVCASCGIPLDATPGPQLAHLGRFHPQVADAIVTLCQRRGIPAETEPDGEDIVVRTDREYRDDLRAELVSSWTGLLGSLPADDMYAILQSGGTQPGWRDAPTGVWIDRLGRMQVEGAEDADRHETRRQFGPAMMVIGGVLALFGGLIEGSELALISGGLLLGIGAFLPR